MKTIIENNNKLTLSSLSRKACIVTIWAIVVYSLIIQYKYFVISNGILIMGMFMLLFFIISQTDRTFDINRIITKESALMIAFMLYILLVGLVFAPNKKSHITQWVTSFEYMLLMIVISSLIVNSGMESFHLLLLTVAIILIVMLLLKPVNYKGTNRLSVAAGVNPNSLGMSFTEGIWIILYFQQKKKKSLIISFGAIIILCYGIILTGSRKSLIASGIIVAFWYLFCFLPDVMKKNSEWKPIILIGSVLMIAIIGIIFFRLYSGSDMASRMEDLQSETESGSRSDMYTFGWGLFQRNPLFGLGFQGFKYYYHSYSHATLVEVPVSGGIVGSIIYYASYFVSIRKIIYLLKFCRAKKELREEFKEIRMLLFMWVAMLFYCTCIIHPYQFDSYIVFGIIFGQSAYIEKKIMMSHYKQLPAQKCKWIR